MRNKIFANLKMDKFLTIWIILSITLILVSCGSVKNVRNGSYNLLRYSAPKERKSEQPQKNFTSNSNQQVKPTEVQNFESNNSKIVTGEPIIKQSNCNEEDFEFLKFKMTKLEDEIKYLRNEIDNLTSLLSQKDMEKTNSSQETKKHKSKDKVKVNSTNNEKNIARATKTQYSKQNTIDQKASKTSKATDEQIKTSFDQNKRIEEIVSLIKEKKYDDALAKIDIAFKEENDLGVLSTLWYWKGEALFYKRDFVKAIECFQKVLSTPGSRKKIEAQIMTAECYTKLGKLKEAKREYQKFIEEYPFSEYVPRAKRMVQQL
ncbi:MAG: tetratricopeptide repeat protein [Candidatus Kapaibacteriota bacterium]